MAEAHWSTRGHPGELSARWTRLQTLALGSAASPRSDGIDLTVTNPEALGLAPPEARELVARAATHPYQPEAGGPRRARLAIAQSYAARSADRMSAEDVLVTASTSESYSFLLHVLCDAGDTVLVPRPSYPLLPDLARLADVRLRPYDLRYAAHFQLDPASLPSAAEIESERIRAAIVVSPNHPTGHFTSQGELELLATLGLPLIVDEVFRTFAHRPDQARGDVLALDVPGFLLDGLSKRAALPGLKAGWVATLGNASFRKEARSRLEAAADTFLSVSAVAQGAIAELLEREVEIASPTKLRLEENLELLRSRVRGTPLTLLEPEAGWSAILRLPAVRSEREYFGDLAALGVWVHPGELYDLALDPCVVVSLLCLPEQLDRGISRILSLLSAL